MLRRIAYIGILLLYLSLTLSAQVRYHPGDVVPEAYLKVFGTERFFKEQPIDEELKQTMEGCSFKDDKVVSWDKLCYLQVLHRDAEGNSIVGELVCNIAIAEELMLIFRELYEKSYPIERMRLIDYYYGDDEASMRDNNTSCFNQRKTTAGAGVSKHSFGMAVDINPKYNPYYKVRPNGKTVIRPEGSEEYTDRKNDSPYMIKKGDACYRLFKRHGFYWGGDWASGKDYQHFEKP